MSGIETAGLVLGALPIIVELIKAYAKGASTIRRFLRYERPLRSLSTELGVEYVLCQNAYEQLLDGLIDDTKERDILLQYPGGPAWKDPELERKLEQRLSRGYLVFVETVKEIEYAVSEIKSLLKFSPDGKPQFNAENGFEHEYLRLKFSLKKSNYDEHVSAVRKYGTALRELTNQSIMLEPSRSARKPPDLDIIRSYLASLYTAFCTGLQCSCKTAHVLHLRLEHIKKCCTTADLPSFRVALLYSPNMAWDTQPPWTFEEFDIRPSHEEAQKNKSFKRKHKKVSFSTTPTAASLQPPPQPKAGQITQMCSMIHQLKATCIGDYIGFVEDELHCQKMDLYLPGKRVLPKGSVEPSFLPLRKALDRKTSRRRRFSKRDSLKSAVLLSSNLLQLYQTPWMTEMWTNDDIAFFEGSNGSNLEEPFVSRASSDQSDNSLSDSGFSPWDGPIRNQFLFSLGILLIELCLDAPFTKLRSNFEEADSDIKVANQLLEEVAEEFGPYYSNAVRRCIRCDFDTDKMDLEDLIFSKTVYERVVIPLEDALKTFNGSGTV